MWVSRCVAGLGKVECQAKHSHVPLLKLEPSLEAQPWI